MGRISFESGRYPLICAAAFCFYGSAQGGRQGAGPGVRVITPKQPMWTSGYGGMKEPARETIIDLK